MAIIITQITPKRGIITFSIECTRIRGWISRNTTGVFQTLKNPKQSAQANTMPHQDLYHENPNILKVHEFYYSYLHQQCSKFPFTHTITTLCKESMQMLKTSPKQVMLEFGKMKSGHRFFSRNFYFLIFKFFFVFSSKENKTLSQKFWEKTQYLTLTRSNSAKNMIGSHVHSFVVANQGCLPQALGQSTRLYSLKIG